MYTCLLIEKCIMCHRYVKATFKWKFTAPFAVFVYKQKKGDPLI